MTAPEQADGTDGASDRPIVSVIVANFNGAAYLADALRSIQRQTLRQIEIIVSDDGSTDDSVAIVESLVAADPRIRLLQSPRKRGPAAARNDALAVARGEWIAVMDSDDLMHPDRLRRLVEAARRDNAVLIADNILAFQPDVARPPRPLLRGRWMAGPRWVDLAAYVEGNLFYVRAPALGFLKPLFHASILANHRYDEALLIGEDYDLVARLLNRDRKLRVYPDALYFYRQHPASLTKQRNKNVLHALRMANERLLKQIPPSDQSAVAAVNTRMYSIDTAMMFDQFLAALKTGKWLNALLIASRRPQVIALLRVPAAVHGRRLLGLIPVTFSSPLPKSSEWRLPGEVEVKR